MILKHLCKAGNGSIPTSHYSWDDPPETSTFGLIPKCFGRCRDSSSQGSSSDSDGEEEKIARYFSGRKGKGRGCALHRSNLPPIIYFR